MLRRGQKIILQDEDTSKKITVTVIMHDSYQGFLAVNKEADWTWYREKSNAERGRPGPYYKCIKRIAKKRKKKRHL